MSEVRMNLSPLNIDLVSETSSPHTIGVHHDNLHADVESIRVSR